MTTGTNAPAAPGVGVPPAPGGRPGPDRPFREIRRALGAAQKTSKGSPAYGRYVNRPAGRVLAAASYKAGLTPNAVTGISAVFTFGALAVLAVVRPTWWVGVVVALLLMIGYAFDAADGQLARLRGGGSSAGEWLDHMVDATKIASMHLVVLVAWYRFGVVGHAWLLIPLGFSVVASVMFFGMILNDQLRRHLTARTGRVVDRGTTSPLRSLLVMPTDYGVLCVAFALWGVPAVFPWVYVLLFAGNLGFMMLAAVKWFRDMQALDKPEFVS
jgi:phosphatidylglycerophosphate synthase